MKRVVARRVLALMAAVALALGVAATAAPNRAAAIDPCTGYDLCVHVTITQIFTTQNGAGWVTSTPSGIHCQFLAGQPQAGTSTCDWYFHANFVTSIQVDLEAVADPNNTVACKADHAMSASCGTITTYSATGSVNKGFDFEHDPITVTIGNAGLAGGFVYSTPTGIDCGEQYAACSHSWPWGTSLSLYAEGDNGGVFKSWTGYCAGNNESCEVGLLFFDLNTTAVFGDPPTPTPPPTPKPTAKPSNGPRGSATPGPNATRTPAPGQSAPAASQGVPRATQGTSQPSAGATLGATSDTNPSGGAATPGTPDRDTAAPTNGAVAIAASNLPGQPASAGTQASIEAMPIVIAIIAAGGLIAIGIVAAAYVGRRGRRSEG